MKINLFDLLEYRPYWRTQYVEDDYVGITLLLGTFGFLISLWFFLTGFVFEFSISFLTIIDEEVNLVLIFFNNILFNFLVSILISLFIIGLILRNSELYEGYNLADNFEVFQEDIDELLSEQKPLLVNIKKVSVISIVIGFGLLTGLFYSILLIIPFFIMFFVILFILTYLIQLSPFLFIVSIFITWFTMIYFVLNRKLTLKSSPKAEIGHTQPITKRDIEIIHSEEPPIICSNCRSFIPSGKNICPVCNEKVEEYEI